MKKKKSGKEVKKKIPTFKSDREAERFVDTADLSEYDLSAFKPVKFKFRGSGNIYHDFNIPDADVRQLKAILAVEIIKALDRKDLSVRKAQSLTGIDAGDFSRVRNANFRRISVERLMAMINGLGSRVEVKVKVRRAEKATHGATA